MYLTKVQRTSPA